MDKQSSEKQTNDSTQTKLREQLQGDEVVQVENPLGSIASSLEQGHEVIVEVNGKVFHLNKPEDKQEDKQEK